MIHNKFRYLLTLVALFAISTGAWATEPKVINSTVAVSDLKEGDILIEGAQVTLTSDHSYYLNFLQNRFFLNDATTPSISGFIHNTTTVTVGANGLVTGLSYGATARPATESGEEGNAWEVTAVEDKTVSIVGITYDATAEPPITVAWDASTKTGTFTMPGSDVVLTPEYYPGMLTLPASLTGGKLEVVGLTGPFTKLDVPATWENDNTLLSAAHLPGLKEMTDAEAQNWTDVPSGYVILIYGFDGTKAKLAPYFDGELTFPGSEEVTLSQLKEQSAVAEIYYSSEAQMPAGFEQDEKGNIFVADKTEFKVKATPAEGYRLVSLMFGETDVTDQVDADGIATLTMPEGNIDLELTATFAEITYAVTFADDTAEPTLWTAEPATGVKKGQTVTVTYTGAKKVIGVKAEKKAKAATLADALVDGATVVIAFSYGYLSTNTFTNNNGTFTLTDATGFGAADDETTQLTADGSNLIFKANWDTSIDKNWSNLGFQVTIDTTDNTYVVWKSDTAQGYSAKFTSITVNGTEIQLTEMK